MSQSGTLRVRDSVLPPDVPIVFHTNGGDAIPVANALNVFGAGGTVTSGAGNTITITSAGGGGGVNTFTTDNGVATQVAGNINVFGGTGVSTSGSGSTVTINTPFSPNKVIRDFDDFIAGASSSSKLFPYPIIGWDFVNGNATNPGLIKISSSGVGNGFIIGGNSSPFANPFILGGGQLSINLVMNLEILSNNVNNYTCYIGLLSAATSILGNPPTDGVYFKYNHAVNGGKWQIVTNSSSISTTADSGVFAATGFHNLGIVVNANATSVSYYIDGVQVSNSPIASNIPLSALSPTMLSIPSAGSMPDQYADLFYYEQILTTAR